jgi:beta-glucosidase
MGMSKLLTTAPGGFGWATGIEDTFVPQSRPGLRALDEYELTQHYGLWRSDLDLAADTGARAVRWGIPWYRVQPGPAEWDWRWTDQVLDYMVNVKRLTPILDLMHYGTPTWLAGSFADPCYPERVAEYAGAVAARYKSLVQYYTPLNEPTINAHMCGRQGEWPPHHLGEPGYVRVLMAVARGIVLTVQALRAAQPGMRTIQVEAVWHNWTRDESLKAYAAHNHEMQYLGFDLATGRVVEGHPLRDYLCRNGAAEADLDWLAANAATFDFLGANYYPWSHAELAARKSGGVTTIRRKTHGATLATVLKDAYARYGLPLMVTETSAKGSLAARGEWMDQTIAAVADLRQAGVPVVGYTWFPLLTMIDWKYRTGRRPLSDYLLHLGLYDSAFDGDGVLRRQPTELVARFQAHIARPMPAIGEPETAKAMPGALPFNPAVAG